MKFEKRPSRERTGRNTSKFIKLKDGETVIGVFRGEPSTGYVKWTGSKYIPSTEEEAGSSWRFKMNFVVKENGALVAKIFENGSLLWDKLAELSEDYDIERHTVKIKRSNSGDYVTYDVIPVKDGELNDQAIKALESVELHDLGGSNAGDTVPNNGEGDSGGFEDILGDDADLPF